MKVIAETERLVLREFHAEDAEFITQLLNTEKWIKYIGNKQVKSLEDARQYINRLAKSYNENGFGLWCIELKETSSPIGMCGLVKREGLDDIDIGFALMPEQENKGFAFEAAAATIKIAKETGAEKLLAITAKDNAGSIRLLEKLGLHFSKYLTLPNKDEELVLMEIELMKPAGMGSIQ
jgi:RimJ/RimL family protein N-acetyltransferase